MRASGARGAQRYRAAAILAAGGSSRLGEPKQLVQFAGETLLSRAIRTALEAGATTVFAVLGAESERILNALGDLPPNVRVLLNTAWERGMASSVVLAAAAAERAMADDLVVMTCDQPSVTPEHLLKLLEASKADRIAASLYGERNGVPAVFPSFAFDALQELTGDAGARLLLQHHDVVTVPLPGGVLDVDTPADLERLRAAQLHH